MTTATLAAPKAFGADVEQGERESQSWANSQEDNVFTVEAQPPSPKPPFFDFISRLLEFVEWAPGWDGAGAEHVDHATAKAALATAQSMRAVAPEPFVAPAPSGSLLLQWDFADERSVEVYVDSESEFPATATLTREGVVHEVELTGPAALRSLLEEHAAMATAG